MADKRIDQLPSALSLANGDLIVTEQTSAAKKATMNQVGNYINSRFSLSTLSSDVSTLQTTVAGKQDALQFPIPINQGGTGANSAASARTNLGLGTAAVADIDDTLSIQSAVADAKATGNVANSLKSVSNDYISTFYTDLGGNYTIYKNKGLSTTGASTNTSYACRTTLLTLTGSKVAIGIGAQYQFSAYWYTTNTMANGVLFASRVAGGATTMFTLPDTATTIAIVFYTKDHDTTHTMTDVDVEAIHTSLVVAYENNRKRTFTLLPKFEHMSLTVAGRNADNGITPNLFYTRFRQQRFLTLTPRDSVSIGLETGETATLWEYDKDMELTKRTDAVQPNAEIAVSGNTYFIKFTLLPASEQRYSNCAYRQITVKSLYEPKLVANKKLRRSQRAIFAVPYPLPQDISETDASTYTPQTHEVGYSAGILMLPDTYTPDGKTTQLVIFCHSSGYYFDFTQGEFDMHSAMYDYLLAEGYAVFDTWGHSSFATPSNKPRVYGNPDNMACYSAGYKWVIDNYNIDTNGVLVSGKSLGGNPAMLIAFGRTGIPVKAAGLMAPATNFVRKCFGYQQQDRFENAWAFGMTDYSDALAGEYSSSIMQRESFQNLMSSQYEKFCDWIPFWANTDGVINNKNAFLESAYLGVEGVDVSTGDGDVSRRNQYSKKCNVPVKFWCSVDDDSVPYRANYNFIHMLKNGGSVAELRTLKSGTGSHHAMDFDEPLSEKLSSVVTATGITVENVPVAYYELTEFFKRFK